MIIPLVSLVIYQRVLYGSIVLDSLSQGGASIQIDGIESFFGLALYNLSRCPLNLRCYTYYTVEPAYGIFAASPILSISAIGFVLHRIIGKRSVKRHIAADDQGFSTYEKLAMGSIAFAYLLVEISLIEGARHNTEFGSRYALAFVPFLTVLTAIYAVFLPRVVTITLTAISGLFAVSSTLLGTGNSFYQLYVLYPVAFFAVKGPFSPLLRSLLEATGSNVNNVSGLGATALLIFVLAIIWQADIISIFRNIGANSRFTQVVE